MATNYYSSIYALAPNRGTAAYIPQGVEVDTVGKIVKDIVTVKVTASLGANDTFTISNVVPAGTRVESFDIVSSVALDTGTQLTIDVGWTASTATLISNQAAMRDTAVVSATRAQVLGAIAAVAGDNLLVTIHTAPQTPVAAGGTVTICYTLLYP